MTNFNKLGCGIIVSLTLGMSGCYMDSNNYRRADDASKAPSMATTTTTAPSQTKKVAKSAVKEPIQQTTPGPKRTAAPQIPVIQ